MWNTFVIAIFKPRVVVFQKYKKKIFTEEKLFVFAMMTF